MRISGFAIKSIGFGLAWCAVLSPRWAAAGPPSGEEELRSALEGLAKATAAKDVDAALDYYSDAFAGSRPPYTKKEVRDVYEYWARASRRLSRSFKYHEFRCAGDVAMALVTETLEREPWDQNDAEVVTRELQIHLEKHGGRWRILWDYELDPDGPVLRAGDEYVMPSQGYAVTLPKGYSYHQAKTPGGAAVVVGVTDDLRKVLAVKSQTLGVRIHQEQLGDIVENQIALLYPDCAVMHKELGKVQNLPAVHLEYECPRHEGIMWARSALVMNDKNLLVVSIDGLNERDRGGAAEEIQSVLSTSRAIPREEPGRAVGTTTYGKVCCEKYGLEVDLPEGWQADVRDKGRTIRAKDPAGEGSILVAVVDLLEDTDAKGLVARDDETTARIVEDFLVEKSGPISAGGLEGAQSVSRFKLGDGVVRWRAYFRQGRRAYVIICDAQPVQAFERLEPEFRRTIQSLRVKPVSPPTKPMKGKRRE
ncbi:MAG: hypothetical protein JSU68_11830 [Phycisphaerales bacterium]|nr:MAG: hypothetical protein JSU68_11830 [Phycisphaerales bacterium]